MQRRMVLTKEIIALAQVDNDTMIDHIHLAEIESISVMETDDEEYENILKTQAEGNTENKSQDRCTLSIKCMHHGHNRGRIYYIRTETPDSTAKLCEKLTQSVSAAKFRRVAKTRFAKSQYLLRKIMTSTLFHYTSASLIVGVSSRVCRLRADFCTALSGSLPLAS